MAEYIDREAALDIVNGWREQLIPTYGKNDEYVKCLETVAEHLETLHAADVVERKTGRNVATEYDDCDQFVCSECGIELQYWRRAERDEDDGDVTYHEYRFRFCPNCGAKMEVPTDA